MGFPGTVRMPGSAQVEQLPQLPLFPLFGPLIHPVLFLFVHHPILPFPFLFEGLQLRNSRFQFQCLLNSLDQLVMLLGMDESLNPFQHSPQFLLLRCPLLVQCHLMFVVEELPPSQEVLDCCSPVQSLVVKPKSCLLELSQ